MRKGKLSEGGGALSRTQRHIDKVIVDGGAASQKVDNNFHENIQKTVTDAINSVDRDHTIKITSNLYEEETITITKPGFVIQPKEKGGEVTIQQRTEPCFIIDIGKDKYGNDNTCEIENLRMLLKGMREGDLQ